MAAEVEALRWRTWRTARTVCNLPLCAVCSVCHMWRSLNCLCNADKLTAKAQKITIKLPWEIMTMFSDVLPTDDEEDEDDIEAHEASIQRLKVRTLQSLYFIPLYQCPRRKRMTQHDK